MRILSLEKLRQGGKFKVTFDDGVTIVVRREVMIDFGLRRNDEFDERRLAELKSAQTYQDAFAAAMRLLNYRMRTLAELKGRLKQKDFDPGTIERVAGKLVDLGLVDDSSFADAFVASKISGKPVGTRELERKLREKGVSKEIASAAVQPVRGEGTQLRLALSAAKKRLRSMGRLDDLKKRDRLAAFLVRRGFDWSIISKTIRQVLKGDDDAIDL